MIKVISNNQLIADHDIYNKVNSIEELVSLTKVNDVYFCAFGTEDLVEGNDLEIVGSPTLRVEDYCDEHGITYDSLDTIDRDTEKVTQWFLYCGENGFTPFWFVGISYKHGYEFTETKRTTLKSDLYVGQKVWFAHGVDICEGEIAQVCLRTESNLGKDFFGANLFLALRSTGIYVDTPSRKVFDYLDKLKDGYVMVKSKKLPYSTFNINNYDSEDRFSSRTCNFAILPLDKVFTKSPF